MRENRPVPAWVRRADRSLRTIADECDANLTARAARGFLWITGQGKAEGMRATKVAAALQILSDILAADPNPVEVRDMVIVAVGDFAEAVGPTEPPPAAAEEGEER